MLKRVFFLSTQQKKSSQGSTWIGPPQQLGLFITLDQHLMAMWNIQTGCGWLGLVIPVTIWNPYDNELPSSVWEMIKRFWSGPLGTRSQGWRFGCSFTKLPVMLFPSLLLKILPNYFNFWVFQKVRQYQKADFFTSCQLFCALFFFKRCCCPGFFFSSRLMLLNWDPFSLA